MIPGAVEVWDAVVAGGGPAGCAAAIGLADAGARVLLVEREAAAHHKVCGEFVSVEAGGLLRALGLDPVRLGAVPVERVRLLHGSRVAATALPFPAESLSRRTLDERLLDLAAARGATVRRGVAVRAAEAEGGAVRARLSDGTAAMAGALFLATGKHDLRGHARGPGIQNDLIGFKMHLELPPAAARALDGTVHLLLFDGGYAGLQPLGDAGGERGRVNLCLLVGKRRYEALGRSWPRLVGQLTSASPHWRALLAEARPCWDRPLSVYGVPYGYVAPASAGPVFRLGDQMAVVPSFAGDGIAIALRSARLAVEAWCSPGGQGAGRWGGGEVAGVYHKQAAGLFGRGVRTAARGARVLEHGSAQALAVLAAGLAPDLLAAVAAAMRLGGDAAWRKEGGRREEGPCGRF